MMPTGDYQADSDYEGDSTGEALAPPLVALPVISTPKLFSPCPAPHP